MGRAVAGKYQHPTKLGGKDEKNRTGSYPCWFWRRNLDDEFLS
jgi:hypothetical protein